MKKTTIFKATFAPHDGAETAVQKKIDEIEGNGGDIMSVSVQISAAYIIAKFPTVSQKEADRMVKSGEATIPAEAVSSEGHAAEAPSNGKPSKPKKA